ncbi:phage baseplate assembly protein [Martelella sp. HB161492]|uniref:phage baseplate assembly protein domain-containing protein n=1 Tax=Martelella sp. HB161492 TaxID=2720726 RepID=UPI00158FA881|nr:phage baseplate assembly protein [Martelella sp. HB161492]
MNLRQITLNGDVSVQSGRQFMSGQGHYNDGFTNLLRIEPHGFASVPVKGARAIVVYPRGNPEQAFIIGGESGQHRPSLPSGGAALYDSTGNIVKVIGSGIVVDVAGRTITITAGQWTLTGDAEITGNLTLNGDLTVNGNIGASGNGTFGGSVTDGDGDGGA